MNRVILILILTIILFSTNLYIIDKKDKHEYFCGNKGCQSEYTIPESLYEINPVIGTWLSGDFIDGIYLTFETSGKGTIRNNKEKKTKTFIHYKNNNKRENHTSFMIMDVDKNKTIRANVSQDRNNLEMMTDKGIVSFVKIPISPNYF